MRRTFGVLVGCCLLLSLLAAPAAAARTAGTLVDCRAGADLQAAITAATPGDTLLVRGTCTGNFIAYKDLVFEGVGPIRRSRAHRRSSQDAGGECVHLSLWDGDESRGSVSARPKCRCTEPDRERQLIPPRPSASPTVPVGRSCTGCAQVPFARSGTVKSLAPPIVALLPCRR